MKKYILTVVLVIVSGSCLFAQTAHFVTGGEIEFEKTINMHAVLKKNIATDDATRLAAFEQYKKSQPQFLKLKSTLTFNKTATVFIPEVSSEPPGTSYFGYNPWYMQLNKVYTSLSSDSSFTQKDFLGQQLRVKDKRQPVKWKITDETREIAGYQCRRANGLIQDSVYVVAFFTTKIPLSGGPESFYGLPGMILGLAIPYENVTWFATKVTEKQPEPVLPVPTDKSKAINRKELEEILRKTLKVNVGSSLSKLSGYLL